MFWWSLLLIKPGWLAGKSPNEMELYSWENHLEMKTCLLPCSITWEYHPKKAFGVVSFIYLFVTIYHMMFGWYSPVMFGHYLFHFIPITIFWMVVIIYPQGLSIDVWNLCISHAHVAAEKKKELRTLRGSRHLPFARDMDW